MKNEHSLINVSSGSIGLCILCTLIGLGLLAYGIYLLRDNIIKRNTFADTIGKVVGYDYRENDDGDEEAAIIVEYHVGKTAYTIKSNSYTSHPKKMGTEVEILYNPENPSDATFRRFGSNYLIILAGALFTVFGVIATNDARKKRKNTIS